MTPLPASSACERNQQPIAAAMLARLPPAARVLEIGSGWGQHAVYFSGIRSDLKWQATERAQELDVLAQRLRQEACNLAPPMALDVLQDAFPAGPFDAAYSANTAHIMHWPAVCKTFAGVASRLVAGGLFFLYGPFNRQGNFTSPSNAAFDAHLKARDPGMGIRDLEALESLAARHHMKMEETIHMPANNMLLVFIKQE